MVVVILPIQCSSRLAALPVFQRWFLWLPMHAWLRACAPTGVAVLATFPTAPAHRELLSLWRLSASHGALEPVSLSVGRGVLVLTPSYNVDIMSGRVVVYLAGYLKVVVLVNSMTTSMPPVFLSEHSFLYI